MDSENEALKNFLYRLSKKDEVDAIFLLGGIGRQQEIHKIDKYSDFDISIFLSGTNALSWLPRFSFSLYIEKNKLGRKINLYQAFSKELLFENCRWSTSKCEAYCSRTIYYQKEEWINERISSIINKSHNKPDIIINNIHRMTRFIYSDEKLLYRNSPISLAIMYSKALEFGIECIFMLNGLFMPHLKWIENDLRLLHWKPNNIDHILNEYWSIAGLSNKALSYRKNILITLKDILIEKCLEEKISIDYNYINTSINEDRQILKKTFFDLYEEKNTSFTLDENVKEICKSYISTNLLDKENEEVKNIIMEGLLC